MTSSKRLISEVIVIILITLSAVMMRVPWLNSPINPQDSQSAGLIVAWQEMDNTDSTGDSVIKTGHFPLTVMFSYRIIKLSGLPISIHGVRILAIAAVFILIILVWLLIRVTCPVGGGINWFAVLTVALFSFNPLVLLYGGLGLSLHLVSLAILSGIMCILVILIREKHKAAVTVILALTAGAGCGLLVWSVWWGIFAAGAAILYCFRFSGKTRRLFIVAIVGIPAVIVSVTVMVFQIGAGSLSTAVSSLVQYINSLQPGQTSSVIFVKCLLPGVILAALFLVRYIYKPSAAIKPGLNFIKMFSREQWVVVSMLFIPSVLYIVMFPGLIASSSSSFLPLLLALTILTGFLMHKTISPGKKRSLTTIVFMIMTAIVIGWSLFAYFVYITV